MSTGRNIVSEFEVNFILKFKNTHIINFTKKNVSLNLRKLEINLYMLC